ncbi:MAG TPA: AraC family transcriptional regulator [Gemmatimonadales bacterium]|nr:AraC family transcriptional regulator [Gemmatimonadales bacterium]
MTIVSQRFDSALGRWTHTGWRPRPGDPLDWAVERIWDFDGMAAAPQERVFPNGRIELILQLDERYLDVTPTGVLPTPAACVTGIHSRASRVQAPRRACRVLGVRLHPAGAWTLLGHPLGELADLTADLGDLLGRGAAELAARCHDADSGTVRVRLVVGWLRDRLQHSAAACAADPAAQWVARRIAAGGDQPIRQLRDQAGLSDGRLASLFRQQVGVTPKRYARIHRLDRALTLLARADTSLARVAGRAGYYDQPHMNAEFRDLAGLTPRQFLAAIRFPESLSLPEPA